VQAKTKSASASKLVAEEPTTVNGSGHRGE